MADPEVLALLTKMAERLEGMDKKIDVLAAQVDGLDRKVTAIAVNQLSEPECRVLGIPHDGSPVQGISSMARGGSASGPPLAMAAKGKD